MSQIAAKRRRRQHSNGFGHICKMDRPRYNKRSAEAMNKRLQQKIEKEKAIQNRKGGKKK